MKRIIGIDPSINHTGYGIIMVDADTDKITLDVSGVIRTDKDGGGGRLGELAEMLNSVFQMQSWDAESLAVIEWPTFEDSPRGRNLARKGYNKLCAATGVAIAVAETHGVAYTLVTAKQWKGETPKPQIRERVEEVLFTGAQRVKGVEWEREDEWEALGIALWANAHFDGLLIF
jgi:Holliday junction resolvasome RuvABC endonuclease subunit